MASGGANPGVFAALRREAPLLTGYPAVVVAFTVGASWFSSPPTGMAALGLFLALFGVMMWLSFAVVRHADCLAILLGEPLGTLILTISVITIEVVMISAIMLTGEASPTAARDTMFAVLMIVLNLLVGLSMLLGALRREAPAFNLQGANAFLGVLVPLSLLTLVLPRFTESRPGGEASPLFAVLLIVSSVVLYTVFLGIQTMLHRGYFVQPGGPAGQASEAEHHDHGPVVSLRYHAIMLPLAMLPIVLLSKSMAKLVDHGVSVAGAPLALGGVVVALLVLSPEGLAAIRAARANQMQRSINIGLGSALATIGMTVPAVLIIGFVTGQRVEVALEPAEIVLLGMTLLTSVVNASAGRTNVLQGAVHLLLFATYVVLLFD